jgi:hypothetical protein
MQLGRSRNGTGQGAAAWGFSAPHTLTAVAFGLCCCVEETPDEGPIEIVAYPLEVPVGGTTSGIGGSTSVGTVETTGGVASGGAESSGSLRIASHPLFSELKIDPPGTDGNNEFIELSGEPNETLQGFWAVVIEGDAESNLGQIDKVFDFSSCGNGACTFGSNGILLLMAAEGAVAATSSVGSTAIFSGLVRGGLENGTGFIGLYRGGTPPKPGTDWDINDDGVLELPNGVIQHDAITWTDGDAGDGLYAATVAGPKPLAQAVVRCVNGAEATTILRYGQLRGEATTLEFEPLHLSPTGLTAETLTPGAPNVCRAPEPLPTLSGSGGASPTTSLASAGGAYIAGESSSPSSKTRGTSVASPAPESANSEGNASSKSDPDSTQSSPTGTVTATASSAAWWSPSPFDAAGGTKGVGGSDNGSSAKAGHAATSADPSKPPKVPGGCSVSVPSTLEKSTGWSLLVGLLFFRKRRRVHRALAENFA